MPRDRRQEQRVVTQEDQTYILDLDPTVHEFQVRGRWKSTPDKTSVACNHQAGSLLTCQEVLLRNQECRLEGDETHKNTFNLCVLTVNNDAGATLPLHVRQTGTYPIRTS